MIFRDKVRGLLARARGEFDEIGVIKVHTKEALEQAGYRACEIEQHFLNGYLTEHNA